MNASANQTKHSTQLSYFVHFAHVHLVCGILLCNIVCVLKVVSLMNNGNWRVEPSFGLAKFPVPVLPRQSLSSLEFEGQGLSIIDAVSGSRITTRGNPTWLRFRDTCTTGSMLTLQVLQFEAHISSEHRCFMLGSLQSLCCVQ